MATIEIRQIEYVQAVARHRSFTRAAEELHVAQPALSMAIRHVESLLGVRLFERDSRRVALTDAGAAFVARASRVSREVELLTQEMDEYTDGERGVLRASVLYHLEPELIGFLHEFVSGNPLVTVSTEELPTTEALTALRRGDTDVASVEIYPGLDLGGIEHVVVRTEPFVLAAPPAHPLAGRQVVAVEDLAHQRFIVTRPGSALRRCLDRIFAGHGGNPDIAVETDEITGAIACVSAGLGVAVATPTIVRQVDPTLSLVPLSDVDRFVVAVAWRSGSHNGLAQRAIDLIRAQRCGRATEEAA